MEIPESRQDKELLERFIHSPVANVLVLIDSKDETYPYRIAYIAQIQDQNLVLFDWKYSYGLRSKADTGMNLARKDVDNSKLRANFTKPYIAALESFDYLDIVRVIKFDKPMNWKKFIPVKDPEGILKIFP
jgi:hypothetical protein